jgi:phage terminase Nu1 subunit (DNA packaging protein)
MASAAQCAKRIDLKERRFRELVDLGVFERAARGDYDIDEITVTYIRKLRAEAAGRADSAASLTKERVRIARANANVAERKDHAEEGKLVDLEAVATAWNIERSVVREKLLSLGGELQGPLDMIPGVDAANIVEGKAREILLELSEPDALVRRAARAGVEADTPKKKDGDKDG